MDKPPEDMTTNELLIQLNQQLADLRRQNQELLTVFKDDRESTIYKCQTCGGHIPEDERETHQVEQHNAPAEIDHNSEYVEL